METGFNLGDVQEFGNDCLLVYVDAGRSLIKSKDWGTYFDSLETYDTTCVDD